MDLRTGAGQAKSAEPEVKMRRKQQGQLFGRSNTQLDAIRRLMLQVSRVGIWLTLGEIAEATEIGEASASAQLRHLRKVRHGRYRVEKRYRRPTAANGLRDRPNQAAPATWEYRVLPPAAARSNPEQNGSVGTHADAASFEPCA